MDVKNKDFEITTLKSTITKQEEELTTLNPVNSENKIQESTTISAFDRPLPIETGEKITTVCFFSAFDRPLPIETGEK